MSEIHVFVLWSSARAVEERILADLSTRFELLDAVRLEWSESRFEENLRRLYGWDRPAGIDKATETGTDPFLLLVVRDPGPLYAPRRRSWGMAPVNVNTYDAKHRYRRWTSAAFAIHASNDAAEAQRDLFLLLARPASDYAAAASIPWPSPPRALAADVVGADGWRSLGELLTALELAWGYALLSSGRDIDEAAGELEILAADGGRVRHLLGFGPHGTIDVAGRPWALRFHVPGDGDLDARWQLAILREAVTAPSGARVAGPRASRVRDAVPRRHAHLRAARAAEHPLGRRGARRPTPGRRRRSRARPVTRPSVPARQSLDVLDPGRSRHGAQSRAARRPRPSTPAPAREGPEGRRSRRDGRAPLEGSIILTRPAAPAPTA